MAKLTLTDLANLENETTAIAVINANSAATITAMNNTLSLDGTTPNSMGADLDMNSYQIINLPAPTSAASPARLQDVVDGVISVPDTGTSGHVIPYLDGDNTWSGTNAFTDDTTAISQDASNDSTLVATTAFVQDVVAANAVSLGSIAGLSVVGRSASTTGVTAAITGTASKFLQVNSGGTALGFATLAGDATLSGPTITLATVNGGSGSVGSSTAIPVLTTNAKGLVTAQTTAAVIAPAGTLTGTTLVATVVTSSLSKVGPTVQIGATDAASPTASVLSGQSVIAGTADTAGVSFTIKSSKGTGTGAGGTIVLQTAPAGGAGNAQNSLITGLTVTAPAVSQQPSVVVGNTSLATTATDGFLYIPGGAGAPVGTPTSFGGRYPLYWDTTAKKLYIYDTSWLGSTAPGVWS
jgi:hypothetical protein